MSRNLLICVIAGLIWSPTVSAVLWGGHSENEQRVNAARFVLEKLREEQGDGWDRTGRWFVWSYKFSRNACELEVQRENSQTADYFRQRIPMARVSVAWNGKAHLQFACDYGDACIEIADSQRDSRETAYLNRTQVLVMRPHDLPRLMDAFEELHYLCDEAYSR